MAERSAARVWGMRLTYVAVAFAVFFLYLLPLSLTPARIAGPDVLVAVTFAWVLRRPDYVPPILIAGVMLLADFLFMRPPGLWAALVLIGAEWLKRQSGRLRENTFAAEWLAVAVVLLTLTALYRVIQWLLIVPHGTLFMVLSQFVMTLAIYPIVVGIGHILLGIRHTAPGEFDPVGRSL
ncbi:rod shape-determining protein MreD [Cognatishimia sp. F0-27]|uniref:rod shape-determining protein MreD n=1 Tax=Cognatishimia sp. F0-27 TaxID=2816855 RepID=UPI001D0C27A5|nr:rod shape-determining protein MreD [Cognatishimia sp. F0-27]MCC1491677.1 rod shape-determining protein MreD [Cognatishimia sp. F0-27]